MTVSLWFWIPLHSKEPSLLGKLKAGVTCWLQVKIRAYLPGKYNQAEALIEAPPVGLLCPFEKSLLRAAEMAREGTCYSLPPVLGTGALF